MVLVTGATGHIGNVLVRELVERGETVRAFVLPGEDCRCLRGLGVELIEGDVLDYNSVLRAVQGAEVVYHLAGIISIMPGRDELVRQVNVEGTRNILRASREAGVRRLVHTSSIHAIREAPGDDLMCEDLPFDPLSCRGEYDRSKAEASLAVLEAAKNGLDAVIVCPTGVVGPHDYRGSEMGFVVRYAARRPPQWVIDGEYDFVDVRDVAHGMILAGERGQRGECYILSGERITVTNLIQAVQGIRRQPVWMVRVPASLVQFAARFAPYYYRLTRTRPVLTPYALATLASNCNISSEKARRELGYTTRPLFETLEDTLEWLSVN
jgi:dihydroflavonol-4-reductase